MPQHARLTGRWMLFSALFIAGLGAVALLKFNAFLSESITERLDIVTATSAQDFTSAVDVGLAISEVANGEAILDRGRRHDPSIQSITVFSPTGEVIHSATRNQATRIDDENFQAFLASAAGETDEWGIEAASHLSSGRVIRGPFGQRLAGVAVNYSKEELDSQSATMRNRLAMTGGILAVLLGGLIAGGIRLIDRRREPSHTKTDRIVSVWIAGTLTIGVAVYGLFVWSDFNDLLEPEIERRADLIGLTVTQDVARAEELGIPLPDLVGVDEYFAVFMAEFPEVDHLAIRDLEGDVVHSAGRNGPAITAVETVFERDDRNTDTAVVYGYATAPGETIDIGIDRHFVTSRLQDLALDVIVILLVALVVAFELMTTVSRSRLRAPAGDPSLREPVDRVINVRLILFLFVVAEELNKSFLPLFIEAADNPIDGLDTAVAISLPIVAYLLTLGVTSPVASRLISSLGHRKLFLIGLIPAGLSHLGMIFADNVIEIVVLRALTGIGYALATIAAQEHFLFRLRGENRVRTIGAFVVVIIGGTFSGTALGGIFADRLGFDAVFAISLGLVVLAGLLALRFLASSVEDYHSSTPAFDRSDFLEALKSPQVMMLLAGVTVPMNVLMAAFLWYLVPLSLADLGLDTSAIARTLMLYYLVILLTGPLAGRLADRRLSRWTLVGIGSATSGLSLLLPAFAPTALPVALAVVVVGFGHAAVRGPQVALALDIADASESPGRRGAILAAMRSLQRIGSLVGLLGVSLMVAAFDFDIATGAIGISVFLAGIIFLVTTTRLNPVKESVNA